MFDGQFYPYQPVQFMDGLLNPIIGAGAKAFPIVQATSQGDSGTSPTTSDAVGLPSSVAAGDLLIVLAATQVNGVTPSTPAGWSALTFGNVGSQGVAVIFYKQAAGGETSVTISHSSARMAWLCYRISGWETGTAPEVGTAATGTSTTPNPPSVTPSWGADQNLYVAVNACNNGNSGSTSAYPSGFSGGISQRTQKNDSSDVRISAAWAQLAVSPEDPGTFTSTSGAWVAQTIAIRPQ